MLSLTSLAELLHPALGSKWFMLLEVVLSYSYFAFLVHVSWFAARQGVRLWFVPGCGHLSCICWLCPFKFEVGVIDLCCLRLQGACGRDERKRRECGGRSAK